MIIKLMFDGLCNWSSVSVGSASVDSTNHGSKILGEEGSSFCIEHVDFFLVIKQYNLATVYVEFTLR